MNFFNQVGINDKSSKDDIKKAYIKLAFKHHPDRGGKHDNFVKIKNAYEYLLSNCDNNSNQNSSNNNENNGNKSNYNTYKKPDDTKQNTNNKSNYNTYQKPNNTEYKTYSKTFTNKYYTYTYTYTNKANNYDYKNIYNNNYNEFYNKIKNNKINKLINIVPKCYFNRYTFICSLPFIDHNINQNSGIISRTIKVGLGYIIWPVSILFALVS